VPNVKRHLRLVVNGAKFEIETNALDLVHADRAGQPEATLGLRTAHQACLRLDVDVPKRFDAFLEQLEVMDDLDEEDGGGGDGSLDPTRPAD
jgi:hypothetical protein